MAAGAIEAEGGAAALRAGNTAVLIAPPMVDKVSMSVGVRALEAGGQVDLTLRDSVGTVRGRVTRLVSAGGLQYQSAEELFGLAAGENDSITVSVVSGMAIVFRTAVDGVSGDTSYQLARQTP